MRFFGVVIAALLATISLAALAADARLPDGTLAVPSLARVTDTTNTLSATDKQAFETKLAAFESKRGTQIAVLIVASTQPEPLSDFAQRVGDAWKIGRKSVGDGVLIVLAKDDRRVWIAVARALEGAIPDLAAKRVIGDVMTPRFRQGDFAGGINAGLDQLITRIENEGLPTPAGVSSSTVDAGEDVIGLLLPFVFVGAIVGALLRKMIGVPGALVASGGTGVIAGGMLHSMALGGLAGVAAFLFALMFTRRGLSGRVLGGRRGGVFIPGGGWGGGGWGGGESSGGWSSGGGGDFSGGGAGGDW